MRLQHSKHTLQFVIGGGKILYYLTSFSFCDLIPLLVDRDVRCRQGIFFADNTAKLIYHLNSNKLC